MNTYRYFNNCFYPYSLEDDYKSAGSWPEGGVDVDENIFIEFSGLPPDGKIRATDSDGMPTWIDAPPLTHEEEVKAADQQKEALLTEAQETISFWQTELQLGIISDDDKASLIAWMQYIKAVQAVDTSKAPDITWPTPPADAA